MRVAWPTAAVCSFALIASPAQGQVGAATQKQAAANRDAVLMMDDLLRDVSSGWWFKRYQAGSARSPMFLRYPDGVHVIRVTFDYTTGETDSAMMALDRQGRMLCFYYASDKRCEGVSYLARYAAIAAAVVAAYVAADALANSRPSLPPTRLNDGQADVGAHSQRPASPPPQGQGANRTPRIGGEGGLYGCVNPSCWDNPD